MNPAVTPTSTASTVAMAPAAKPTSRVTRAPASSSEKTSCPVCVVPSQCAADGGARLAPVCADGLYGAR